MSNENDEKTFIRVSNAINIKDIVTFISVAVAITMAWGVFGTRLTITEKELVYLSRTIEQQQKQIETMKEKIERLEGRMRDNEYSVLQLWTRKNAEK